MSAGNHAQGVAYHARRLGIPATIVMPRHTPFVKVENTRRFGRPGAARGRGRRGGGAARREIAARGRPHLRPPVRRRGGDRGPGTLALEMLEAAPDLEVLVVPIGGGGLIGGIATAAKALKPGSRSSASRRRSTRRSSRGCAGCRHWPAGPTIAEGIAVKEPGSLTCRSSSASSPRCCWSRRRRSRPRSCSCSRSRRRWPRVRVRRPRRRDEPSRPLPRPPGRPRPVRRQHRQPPALGRDPARPRAHPAPGAPARRRAGQPGQPGQHRQRSSPSAAATWSTSTTSAPSPSSRSSSPTSTSPSRAARPSTRTRSPPPLQAAGFTADQLGPGDSSGP